MTEPHGPVPGPRPGGGRAAHRSPDARQDPLHQLIDSQTGHRHPDATRYLQAAGHLDRSFRDAVIEELAENPHRIASPSFGIDLVAVLKEAFAARRRALVRGSFLLAVPFAAAAVDVRGALLVPGLILTVSFCLFLGRETTRILGRLAGRLGDPRATQFIRRACGLVWLVLLVFVLLRTGSSVGALLGDGLLQDSGRSCPPDGWTGAGSCEGADREAGLARWAVLLVLTGWTAVAAVDRCGTLRRLHALGTGKAGALPDGRRAERYRQLRRRQTDPDIVYGDYAPFVGAGTEVDHWSFAIELVQDTSTTGTPGAQEPPATGPFTTPVVHAHLREQLLRLGAADPAAAYPGDRMHEISVSDCLFKSGLRVGPAREWSGTGPGTAFAEMAPYARPVAALRLGLADGAAVPATWWADSVDLAARERLRHYLAVRVGSWGEEVVFNVFSRVQLQGGLLFLENRAFVLPPIARAYHAIDTVMPPAGAGDWTALVARSSWSCFALFGQALPDLCRTARTAVRTVRARNWYERMCAANRPVDHGPTCSVRELGAEPEYTQQFQEMDVQRFRKSVQTRTLTAVRESLRRHGYRTDEYDARQNVVINHGVQVNGNVSGNVQSGSHAQATHQHVSAPQPRIGASRD